ncbi:aminotransferase class III-fold pyridoxal phosphate-dependent enzyme [Ancylobacter lacus]|uniref:aminotransferase class III-fold pyridoxal phosphate-dependent enzyme n=1 Tax=Ancylobacter lacus TaxID=2579970 RepID=UPI001BD1A46F|nr:aminotransferase class III-fold pyridoxal phosphate-dependent enzyme [Ancylobacter lacus]MBS7541394.1 aminotransferase class III-fold pyridoxal phosphate-dependent enzyme [Ancylobacter lacus]
MSNSLDHALRTRALRVVPGGMWGHMHAKDLPEGYPQFFARAQGSRLWDVDGNAYLDFMCSWGPIILGHHHPEVDAAAFAQYQQGDAMNGPAETMVELAELMVELVPHADWVQFEKNGTDATTTAATIARAGTGRRKILVARGAYHGAVPWCSPSLVGVTAEDRAHILTYDYNDIDSLNAAVALAEGDLAGILVSAFRHDYGKDQELPTLAFARAARAAADAADAALIVDDVRAGFRLSLGGSWDRLGVRPDLSAWSKAIANGFPLSAVTGNDRFRAATQSIFTTGSFWCGAMSMAAAVATLNILRRDNAVDHMERMGTALREGLDRLSADHGIAIRQTGPVQMPMVLFEDDADYRKGFAFCAAALRAGVYFHPQHNMFLSAAHTAEDIARALEAADVGFRAVRARAATPA